MKVCFPGENEIINFREDEKKIQGCKLGSVKRDYIYIMDSTILSLSKANSLYISWTRSCLKWLCKHVFLQFKLSSLTPAV